MNILIAPNAFKGSLTSIEVAQTIAKALKDGCSTIQIEIFPMADGGDGTRLVFDHFSDSTIVECNAVDALREKISGKYSFLDKDTAIIELAEVSGIRHLKTSDLNIKKANTYGTGLLIKDAVENGAKHILLGLGGSASNDAGLGILEALGLKLFDKNGQILNAVPESFNRIERIDSSELAYLNGIKFTILSDVKNPPLGQNGSANIFAKQKGASEKDIDFLEKALHHVHDLLSKLSVEDVSNKEGYGAAGAIPMGLNPFLDMTLCSGADYLLNKFEFNQKCKNADLIITAEGFLDSQTEGGKAPFEISKRARSYNKKVIAFCGGFDYEEINYMNATFSIIPKPQTLEEALEKAEKNLYWTVRNMTQFIVNLSK